MNIFAAVISTIFEIVNKFSFISYELLVLSTKVNQIIISFVNLILF
jgi:hypothetical protein